jgi:hypothetical protein
MKKIIAIMLCIVLCVGMLCGCSNSERKLIERTTKSVPFERVYTKTSDGFFTTDPHIEYYHDKLTDVMYVGTHYCGGSACSRSMSVMMKPDGTPMLYDEWVELIDNYK